LTHFVKIIRQQVSTPDGQGLEKAVNILKQHLHPEKDHGDSAIRSCSLCRSSTILATAASITFFPFSFVARVASPSTAVSVISSQGVGVTSASSVNFGTSRTARSMSTYSSAR